ncbi:MAG: hypothetical protein ABSB26_08835 [Nitrososphaerales archaeon]|jgi:hypothetical protein
MNRPFLLLVIGEATLVLGVFLFLIALNSYHAISCVLFWFLDYVPSLTFVPYCYFDFWGKVEVAGFDLVIVSMVIIGISLFFLYHRLNMLEKGRVD